MSNQVNNAKYAFKYEVMVVDDDICNDKGEIRDIIEYLIKEGYSVSECVNWPHVFNLLETRFINQLPFPDVALVDLHIPDTSVHQNPELVGIEIMKKIREQCETWKLPQIPCIAYTAKIDSPTLSEIFAAGATNFIPKGDFKDKNALLLRLREHIKDNVMGAHRSSILRKAAG